jgi:hypothetical protein
MKNHLMCAGVSGMQSIVTTWLTCVMLGLELHGVGMHKLQAMHH